MATNQHNPNATISPSPDPTTDPTSNTPSTIPSVASSPSFAMIRFSIPRSNSSTSVGSTSSNDASSTPAGGGSGSLFHNRKRKFNDSDPNQSNRKRRQQQQQSHGHDDGDEQNGGIGRQDGNDDSDDDGAGNGKNGFHLITHVQDGAIRTVGDDSHNRRGPLVIPALQDSWRPRNSLIKKNSQTAAQTGQASDNTQIGATTASSDRSETPPLDEDQVLRRDLEKCAPDFDVFKTSHTSNSDDDEDEDFEDDRHRGGRGRGPSIPIEQFGEALLRGMGWEPGKPIGRDQNRTPVPIVIFEPRHHLLGLGATPLMLVDPSPVALKSKSSPSPFPSAPSPPLSKSTSTTSIPRSSSASSFSKKSTR